MNSLKSSPALVEGLGSFFMAFLTFGFLLAFPEDLDDWFDDDAFLGIFFGLAIGLAGLFKLTYSFIWTPISYSYSSLERIL